MNHLSNVVKHDRQAFRASGSLRKPCRFHLASVVWSRVGSCMPCVVVPVDLTRTNAVIYQVGAAPGPSSQGAKSRCAVWDWVRVGRRAICHWGISPTSPISSHKHSLQRGAGCVSTACTARFARSTASKTADSGLGFESLFTACVALWWH